MSNQLMEEACLYAQGYTPWNPPPYPPSQNDIEETFQLLCQERKELRENQRRVNAQLTTLTLSIIRLVTQFTNEGRKDTLNEEVVECLNHEEVHECLEEVEVENEEEKVEDEDKELKGMEIVHSASSEATPPESPSKLYFEWVNLSDMNPLGPQHYGLFEMNGQLRALCGVSDKKEMDPLVLDKSRFITWEELKFKAYHGHLHKPHNNRAKDEVLSLRKHLRPWQSKENSLWIHKAMGELTKFGIPGKATRINTIGDLLLIWEFLQA
ncbi:hypothetical protein PIB30_034625 [Stylosanthes scabra]|uniref:Uncharacterized protein n=1 Tax=Stylosanthes scabra TaxID=79078 RepID=A0ABU6XBA9_9FABA|nr:hypothetical protein [Stylosanthes scabra]